MTKQELAARIRNLSAVATREWGVLRCHDAGELEACGINGRGRYLRYPDRIDAVMNDCSHDECHHPAALVDMELAVLLRNHADEIADALEYTERNGGYR